MELVILGNYRILQLMKLRAFYLKLLLICVQIAT